MIVFAVDTAVVVEAVVIAVVVRISVVIFSGVFCTGTESGVLLISKLNPTTKIRNAAAQG